MGESRIKDVIVNRLHSKNIKMNGCTRIVFLISRYAIKIPNFIYCHQHFLQGCYANWSERNLCKTFKSRVAPNFINLVAPSYFCSWFGLIQIQARCDPKLEDLTNREIKLYEPLCGGDFKKENFGYYKGRLVCLDYV
jgi:hypothetical protein